MIDDYLIRPSIQSQSVTNPVVNQLARRESFPPSPTSVLGRCAAIGSLLGGKSYGTSLFSALYRTTRVPTHVGWHNFLAEEERKAKQTAGNHRLLFCYNEINPAPPAQLTKITTLSSTRERNNDEIVIDIDNELRFSSTTKCRRILADGAG